MSFHAIMSAIRSGRDDVDLYDDLARAALAEGEEEAALHKLLPAAERTSHPLLWQWAGLLQRSLDQHEQAIGSFQRASRLAPNDPLIAHSHARVVLEAGLDAVDLFLRARVLAPGDGAVALGLAAARNAIGDGELAVEELAALLQRAPAWVEGHEQLAQLRCTVGQRSRATETLDHALAELPRAADLWAALFRIAVAREDYESLRRDIARAEAAGAGGSLTAFYRAVAAAELDRSSLPNDLFAVSPELDEQLAIWRIRQLLRTGLLDRACDLIDRELASSRAAAVWPYAATAWRLAGDPRWAWLEDDERLVQKFDIAADLPGMDLLARTLRKLHVARGEYLDQSVRGGTQTDGPLLSRVDPVIRGLRRAVVKTVETYLASLPPIDAKHPLLSQRRDRRIRFSGSWSVRLRGGGHHSNHVHPQGWISSALYVCLPDKVGGESQNAGWLAVGEPQEALGLDLGPRLKIEPRPGRLVLFPSWMWHGTVPFAEGERLTVAFDVRPPI